MVLLRKVPRRYEGVMERLNGISGLDFVSAKAIVEETRPYL